MDEAVPVIFVMGLWRSGSTILDIALGNHERIEAVGELRNLPYVGWLKNGVCACGSDVASCAFWSDVRERWSVAVGEKKLQRLIELQDRFERIRSIPRLLRESIIPSDSFQEYSSLLVALFRALHDSSGKKIILDSTKYPARALALSRMAGIDLTLIHLVRDGRAVLWSVLRRPNTDLLGYELGEKPAGLVRRTTRQWVRVNLACEFVSAVGGVGSVRIRYEDFVTRPRETLKQVGRSVGIDTSSLGSRLDAREPLAIGHTVAGNRIRLSGSVRLRADCEWTSELTGQAESAYWRTAGWLARRYGYEKRNHLDQRNHASSA